MDYETLINPSEEQLARAEYYRRYVMTGDDRLCSFEWFYMNIWSLLND